MVKELETCFRPAETVPETSFSAGSPCRAAAAGAGALFPCKPTMQEVDPYSFAGKQYWCKVMATSGTAASSDTGKENEHVPKGVQASRQNTTGTAKS